MNLSKKCHCRGWIFVLAILQVEKASRVISLSLRYKTAPKAHGCIFVFTSPFRQRACMNERNTRRSAKISKIRVERHQMRKPESQMKTLPKLVYVNIRGAYSKQMQHLLSNIINEEGPDILALTWIGSRHDKVKRIKALGDSIYRISAAYQFVALQIFCYLQPNNPQQSFGAN